ncbi:MAG: hypothetical protein KIT31_13280, partial [Deltaproteobacteria bacterium]|nr:hypothetical protein [Deltaproteobacteria bacterium]
MGTTKPALARSAAKAMGKAKGKVRVAKVKVAKVKVKRKAPAVRGRTRKARRAKVVAAPPRSTGTLFDLCEGLTVTRGAAVPGLAALPDGRRVVAWAHLRVRGGEQPRWVARLSS